MPSSSTDNNRLRLTSENMKFTLVPLNWCQCRSQRYHQIKPAATLLDINGKIMYLSDSCEAIFKPFKWPFSTSCALKGIIKHAVVPVLSIFQTPAFSWFEKTVNQGGLQASTRCWLRLVAIQPYQVFVFLSRGWLNWVRIARVCQTQYLTNKSTTLIRN